MQIVGLSLIYFLLVGLLFYVAFYLDITADTPDLQSLEQLLLSTQNQNRITVECPRAYFQNVKSRLGNKELDYLFYASVSRGQMNYNVCTGQFTPGIGKCQDKPLLDFQTQMETLQYLSEVPSVFGKFQFVQVLWMNSAHTPTESNQLLQRLRIPDQMHHISERKLLKSEVDENLKLSGLDSISEFLVKFHGLRYLHQCRYTHIPCDQTTFIVSKDSRHIQSSQNRTFMLRDNHNKTIETLLLKKYQLHLIVSPPELKVGIWYRLEMLKYIRHSLHQLAHLSQILKSKHLYILGRDQTNAMRDWANRTKEVVQLLSAGSYEQAWKTEKGRTNLLHNSLIGKRNLFPSDYKIGLYVPLLVCFVYPIILSLKTLLFSKDGIPRTKSQ